MHPHDQRRVFHGIRKVMVSLVAFGVQPTPGFLWLRSQLSVAQVSRLALRGGCLFSAGHDGQVNHYVVSYAVSSPGMLAKAEPRHFSSAASAGRHVSGECALPSSIEPVGLTIVTTYATAPITTVSELWLGSDGKWEEGPKRVTGGSKGQVCVAVAGRSGSSRMSVWDLTEGRQILEVRFCFGSFGSDNTTLSCPVWSHVDVSRNVCTQVRDHVVLTGSPGRFVVVARLICRRALNYFPRGRRVSLLPFWKKPHHIYAIIYLHAIIDVTR